MTNTFRVVIPTADGYEVAGEFPTRLFASMFQQVILTDRGLKCMIEEFINGQWLDWILPFSLTLSTSILSQMTVTYQHDLTSTQYNGWTNYETWNVSLWIQNDYGFYSIALHCDDYQDFVDALEAVSLNSDSTPDGVNWNDPKLNVIELSEMIQEL